MAGIRRTGATAAAVLPAALAGALLVSAPFAGTTTAPLAKSTTRAAPTHPAASHNGSTSSGLKVDISPTSVAMLAGAEMLLLAVGAGVLVAARRSRAAEEH
jgi:hypothetical protein